MKCKVIRKCVEIGESFELPAYHKIVHVQVSETTLWVDVLVPIMKKTMKETPCRKKSTSLSHP